MHNVCRWVCVCVCLNLGIHLSLELSMLLWLRLKICVFLCACASTLLFVCACVHVHTPCDSTAKFIKFALLSPIRKCAPPSCGEMKRWAEHRKIPVRWKGMTIKHEEIRRAVTSRLDRQASDMKADDLASNFYARFDVTKNIISDYFLH